MKDTKPVDGGHNEIEPLAKMRTIKMREQEGKSTQTNRITRKNRGYKWNSTWKTRTVYFNVFIKIDG